MKKISYEELGKYIGGRASEHFGRWYSDDIKDYADDMAIDNAIYNEDTDIYECALELTEAGKTPLVINYYTKFSYDNLNDIEINYYID